MHRSVRSALTMALVTMASNALAQTGDVTAAAAAFQQAQQAQLVRDYARAADLFELADRAAPSPAALRSAIRNHQAARHRAQAATLALVARDRDASDPQSAQLATSVLAELSPQLALTRVRCSVPCGLALDQAALDHARQESHGFFVEPGHHSLDASFEGRPSLHRELDATAGSTTELTLEAPAAPAPAPVLAVLPSLPTPQPPPSPPPPPPEPTRPLPPVVTFIGLGLTAIAGGVTVWSGVDTLAARDAYVQNPTASAYTDGVGRETRTNALIGATATLGVATAVCAIFLTNWSPRRAYVMTVLPVAGSLPGGAQLGVLASF